MGLRIVRLFYLSFFSTVTLEDSITYIREDEMVEVTPKAIRLRKKILNNDERLRLARNAKKL